MTTQRAWHRAACNLGWWLMGRPWRDDWTAFDPAPRTYRLGARIYSWGER